MGSRDSCLSFTFALPTSHLMVAPHLLFNKLELIDSNSIIKEILNNFPSGRGLHLEFSRGKNIS